MKIRILKTKNEIYSYANKIGEVFDVECEYDDFYFVINDGAGSCISKEDCEEVIEHNSQLYRKVGRPVREGDTVLITKLEGEEMNRIFTVVRLSTFPGDFRINEFINGDNYVEAGVDKYTVIELINPPIQPSAPTYAEVSELLHEANRQTRIDNAFDKVVERNGAALQRLADSDKEDIVEHNGKQYRKVKRKAAVGELVVVTAIIDEDMRDTTIENVYKVVTDQLMAFDYPFVNVIDDVGIEASVDQRGYEVLELIESTPILTEADLIANLAQEVAELKRQLNDAQSDIVDLEDRLDENEKDTEELIGRINDVSDAVIPIEVIEKVIAELEKREDKADDLNGVYEVNYQKELAQFHDGKAHAFMEAIELLKEALRNG